MNLYRMSFEQLTSSQITYLNENYSLEEAEEIKNNCKVSKFAMIKYYNKTQDMTSPDSEFVISDLLSEDKEKVKGLLQKYFRNEKFKSKLYKNGSACEITDRDIDAISEFLQGGVIQLVERYQKVNQYDLDYIEEIYSELMSSDDSPQESVKDYFKKFFDAHFKSDEEVALTPLQSKWKKVMDWAVSETLKEMLIKWIDYENIEENSDCCEAKEKWKLIDIKFIDVDTKSYSKIPLYHKILNNYFESCIKSKIKNTEVK